MSVIKARPNNAREKSKRRLEYVRTDIDMSFQTPSSSARVRSLAALLICGAALAACTTVPCTPYTASDAGRAVLLNKEGLRRYIDDPLARFAEDSVTVKDRTYLALTGGSADGA